MAETWEAVGMTYGMWAGMTGSLQKDDAVNVGFHLVSIR